MDRPKHFSPAENKKICPLLHVDDRVGVARHWKKETAEGVSHLVEHVIMQLLCFLTQPLHTWPRFKNPGFEESYALAEAWPVGSLRAVEGRPVGRRRPPSYSPNEPSLSLGKARPWSAKVSREPSLRAFPGRF